MGTIRQKALAGAAIALVLAIAAAFYGRSQDDSFERIVERGAIRIGYAIEAPFAMLDAEGRVTGESPATAELVVAHLGIARIEWIQMPFDALIAALLNDRIDVIAAGMFVTPERAARIRFSDPTVAVRPALLVPRGNPSNVPGLSELDAAKALRIAVVAGSVEEQRLRDRGLAAEQLVVVPDAQTGRAATTQGLADALALSLPTVRWAVRNAPDRYEIIAAPLEERQRSQQDVIAFGFRPDDEALRLAWNAAQRRVLGSGAHIGAIARFGFEPADIFSQQRGTQRSAPR